MTPGTIRRHMQTLGWSTELKTSKKMFVVLGGSVDRCGSVRVTIALMLMTLDIDYMKPVIRQCKGLIVPQNLIKVYYDVAQCHNVVVGRGREHGVLYM